MNRVLRHILKENNRLSERLSPENQQMETNIVVYLRASAISEYQQERACEKQGCQLYLPPLKLCGDNAAMIGAQGYYEYLAGHTAGMDLNAYATMDISD